MNALDVKDKKLLYEIGNNARLGTSILGKRTGLSQESVHYRVQRLEKRGIILGYLTLLNFGKLGYTGYGIYARFQNVNTKQRKEIIEELRSNPQIYWIAEFGGKYDLAFAIMAKNVIEFNNMFMQISNDYSESLKDLTIAIRTELIEFPREYLIEKRERRETFPMFGKLLEQIKLDKIDLNLLKIISQNPRLSVLEISNKIKNSPITINSHLKKLEKIKIIQGYGAKINCQVFNYESYQLFISARNITEESRRKIINYCASHPNIIFYIETIGKWNFEIIYEIEDQKKLQELIIDIRTQLSDVIADVESIVLFNHYIKYNQLPPL